MAATGLSWEQGYADGLAVGLVSNYADGPAVGIALVHEQRLVAPWHTYADGLAVGRGVPRGDLSLGRLDGGRR